jgi:hypothetical protein
MRSLSAILTTAALTLAVAACGGDDDSTTDADAASPVETETESEQPETEAGEPESEQPETGSPEGGSSGDDAVLTLANGETFEFGILCTLEPQMAAGSEILFTAVSYDTPGLDITQFGDDGTVTGIATISVYDGDFETLWEAGSFYDAFGGSIELSLDGSTIRGSGSFFPGGDIAATPVDGEIVAEC